MAEFLLKLCGLTADGTGDVAGVDVVLRNREWLTWVIVIGMLAGGLIVLSYWRDTRENLNGRRRGILLSLRLLIVAILFLLLLRPVIAFTVESSIRRSLLLLVDSSGSMRIQDPRSDVPDLKRAAIAKGLLDPKAGLEQSLDPANAEAVKLIPRIDVARGMLKNPKLNILTTLREDLDVGMFAFGQTLIEAAEDGAAQDQSDTGWLDALEPSSPGTALGDALRDLITRKRGQAVAGIVVATDGATNVGSPAIEAASYARQEGIPLYLYGVGITSPRDIIVSSLLAQEVAFLHDDLPVTVRVRGQSLKEQTAQLKLTLTPAAGGQAEPVAVKEVDFGAQGEDQVLALSFSPQAEGEFVLSASIEPQADEASRENNAVVQRLRVVNSKVRVLYVESVPRWEFRYLQSAFLRDRRLQTKFVLLEADPGVAEDAASPFLRSVPGTKEELFNFDLLILGDVSPKDFSPEQLTAFEEFVQKFGGSMLFIAGPRSAPASFGGSILEKLLPVELDPSPALQLNPGSGTVVELTPQGQANPLLKLSPDPAENAATWRGFGRIYWAAQVLRAKPAAQVLLADADRTRANRHGQPVIAAFHQYGLGQVFYFGTDNTWRWRRNAGERHYPVLWGQIAQKLGLHHLLGGSKRTHLMVDKQNYTTGDRVTVYARLYGSDYAPRREAVIDAGYTVRVGGEFGPHQDVALRAIPDQPGMYRGEFIARFPGTHRFAVKSDPSAAVELDVAEPKFETGETAMNEGLLRQMAETSGGAFFREENLWQLPQTISSKAERITSTMDGEVWSSPLVFLVLLLMGSAEWWLRKRWELK